MHKNLHIIFFSVMMFVGSSCSSDLRTGDSSENQTEELDMEQTFLGKPAGMALDHFKVGFDDLETHHQRGLTLSAASFEVKKGDHTERVFLWLDCKETPSRGFWDFEIIRKAKVTKITSYQIDMEKSFVGKPAGSALDHYKVGFEDLDMLDEPPGKLRAVSFKVKKGDHTERLHLWLDYNLTLFSDTGHWDFESIRKAKVIKITSKLF